MDYQIAVGETRAVVDANGTPIASATQPGLPYGPGLHATIHDKDGILAITGNSVGVLPFIVYSPGGVQVQHDVTVVDGTAFDWGIGELI